MRIHRWVPWIAGFSAQFVEEEIEGFLPDSGREAHLVLDPFAGVGTTLVEALRAGCSAHGYEINAYAALAARAKVHARDVDPSILRGNIEAFAEGLLVVEETVDAAWKSGGAAALRSMSAHRLASRPEGFRSRIPFFSPPVEAKVLHALHFMGGLAQPDQDLFKAALGSVMVSVSNYSYEPSLGSRPGAGKPLIENASLAAPLLARLEDMRGDIEWLAGSPGLWGAQAGEVTQGSFFDCDLPDGSVSLVVTSPPYMNNYHYLRNTRPQLHWLGLVAGPGSLRDYEQASYGKFWQTVRQGKPVPLQVDLPDVAAMLDELRPTNAERGAYGGAGWANYVATYLNDTGRFVRLLSHKLRPGGRAVVVVGNSIIQAQEFQVDVLLGRLAEQAGLRLAGIRKVRPERVGNSIIESSVRVGDNAGRKKRARLYDAAVTLERVV